MKFSNIPLLCLTLLAASPFSPAFAQKPPWTPSAVVPNITMTGKVMTGYQGWFNAPKDSSGFNWRHFGDTPGNVGFDMWPDMSELDPDERFPTKFKHTDGRVAELFSAYNEKTVLRHFKWMRDYGLDGVFLQRFASETRTPGTGDPRLRKHVDMVLAHVRQGAKEYGRVYGLMYDLSGVKSGDIERIMEDWKYLVDTTQLTKDERYVRHNGKPVVALWGLGFTGSRQPLLDDGLKFVNFLKNDPVYGGNVVKIGVPTQWRTTDNAGVPWKKMEALVMAADIVSPWLVGGPRTPEEIPKKYSDVVKPDIEWCKAHGKDYMPVVFPGFSWYNLRKGTSPSNMIPRLGGRYLWTQYVEAKKAGATMVYQAMFDEVDEGTAIFKVTNDPPDGEGKSQFVTYEGLPSDFYLKLVGQASRLMRGEITPEDDDLVKNAKWTPFVPALPTVTPSPTPAPAVPTAAPVATTATAANANLALNKKYISSDPNKSGWDGGLTDGSWKAGRGTTFATGNSTTFPKTVTIDLEAPTSIGYVALGVPPFGSTKTIKVSLGADEQNFTEVGTYEFSQKKEEKHLFAFAPVTARYVRLTYPDHYTEAVNYPPVHAFTSEVEVYAPGVAPTLAPLEATPVPSAPEPADVAAPKRGPDGQINPGFQASHESFLKRGKAGNIGVLFLGDSITAGWVKAKDVWQERYGPYEPANFGIGGDRTQHVLWRIENGELDGINPKVVVLMIGTNNIGYPAEEITKGVKKIVEQIHQKLPDAKLLLLGIFPRGAEAANPARAKLKAVNAELAKLDDGNKTRYLDIGDKFLDAEGNLPKDIMPDALHPNAQGYQIWADAMQPLLDEMMK